VQTKVCWHVACLQCCFVSMSEHVQLHAGELRRWRTGTCSSGAWHCQAGNLTAALPASKQRSATSRTAQCHWRVQLLPECHCPVPLALHLLPHSSHGMAHSSLSGECPCNQHACFNHCCPLGYLAVQRVRSIWLPCGLFMHVQP